MGFRQWVRKALGIPVLPVTWRSYTGASGGRLTADWMAAGTSADAEIQGGLSSIRNRARDQVRNTPYTAQLKRLYRDNIVGPAGIQLQMQIPNNKNSGLDESAGAAIEMAWRRWCKRESCDVRGKWSFKGFEWYAAASPVDQGEYLFRFVYRAFGKGNKVPLALEPIEPDQLDLYYAAPPSQSGSYWRMGIEFDRWGRPLNYAILTVHPGDYLSQSVNSKPRRHEIVPAEDIIHGYFGDRIQSRGVPIVSPVMGELNQMEGYESAVTVRARAAACQMGFIRTPEGEISYDDIEKGRTEEENERITEFQPGVFKYLAAGEDVVIPDIKAPDNQYEMFVKNKGKRFAAGTGVSYASVTRDATEASYSQQRQEYLQDQDAWSVLQAIQIDTLNQRVFEKWLPLAVLSGAVVLRDFYLSPERYYDSAIWQPRGWAWVDPKKEAEGNEIMERNGYTSKLAICAKLGTSYEKVLRDKRREKELEDQYGVRSSVELLPNGNQSPTPPREVSADE